MVTFYLERRGVFISNIKNNIDNAYIQGYANAAKVENQRYG